MGERLSLRLAAVLAVCVSARVEIFDEPVLIASIQLCPAPVFRTLTAVFAFMFSHTPSGSDSPGTTR